MRRGRESLSVRHRRRSRPRGTAHADSRCRTIETSPPRRSVAASLQNVPRTALAGLLAKQPSTRSPVKRVAKTSASSGLAKQKPRSRCHRESMSAGAADKASAKLTGVSRRRQRDLSTWLGHERPSPPKPICVLREAALARVLTAASRSASSPMINCSRP
jgi:hypothetical protein